MVGTRSVVDNGQLIRKVAIPRHLLVIASSVSALINLGLGMIVVILFAFLSGLFPTFSLVATYSSYMLSYLYLSVGLSLLLSALYVIFRDIAYIWEILLQAGLLCERYYFCGYFYAVSHTKDCIFKSNYTDYPKTPDTL